MSTKSARILLVDTERYLGRRIKQALQSPTWTIYWAQALDEGLQTASLAEPRTILLNVTAATDRSWQDAARALREAAAPGCRVVTYGVAKVAAEGEGAELPEFGSPEALIGRLRRELRKEPTSPIEKERATDDVSSQSRDPDRAVDFAESPGHGPASLADTQRATTKETIEQVAETPTQEDTDIPVQIDPPPALEPDSARAIAPIADPPPQNISADAATGSTPSPAAEAIPLPPPELAVESGDLTFFDDDLDDSLGETLDLDPIPSQQEADPSSIASEPGVPSLAPVLATPPEQEPGGATTSSFDPLEPLPVSDVEENAMPLIETQDIETVSLADFEEPDIIDLGEPPATEEKGAAKPAGPPPDREGDLASIPFDRLLWELYEAKATGSLKVRLKEGLTTVSFVEARPVAAMGGGPESTLGKVMMQHGLLSQEDYQSAVASMAEEDAVSERLGEALLRRKVITPAQLEEGLSRQVTEKILQLFPARQAPFAFYEGRQATGTSFPKSPLGLLLDGLLRISPDDLRHRFKDRGSHFPEIDEEMLPAGFPKDDARVKKLLHRLDAQTPLTELIAGDDNRRNLVLLAAMNTVGCLRYHATPPVGHAKKTGGAPQAIETDQEKQVVEPTPTSPENTSGLYEQLNELYLTVQGKDFYQVLAVPKTASEEQIRLAIETLSSRIPTLEKAKLPEKEAARLEELKSLVREVRETLLDTDKRLGYDSGLQGQESPTAEVRKKEYQIEETLHRAEAAMKSQDFEQAHRLYAKAKELSANDNADILAGLGYTLYMKDPEPGGKVAKEAFALVRRAIDSRPQLAIAAFYAGEILRLEKRPSQAAKFYRHAKEQAPDDPRFVRALKSVEETKKAGPRPYLLFACDLLTDGVKPDVEDKASRLTSRAFTQAARKHFGPSFETWGRIYDKEAILFDTRGKTFLALPFAGTSDRKLAETALRYPVAFKKAVTPHIRKMLAETPTARWRVRMAIAAMETEPVGAASKRRIKGPLLSQSLMGLAKDQGAFAIDRQGLSTLLGDDEAGWNSVAEALQLDIKEAPGSSGSENPLLLFAPKAKSAAADTPKRRKVVRPDRAVAASISMEDLGAIQEAASILLPGTDERLDVIFTAIAQDTATEEGGSIWSKMRGKSRTGPDISKVRLRTRLFEPILKGSKIFLGIADIRHWLKLLEGIGTHYTDALYEEAEAYRKADSSLWDGAKVDPGFMDLERLTPDSLFALSEGCRLFPSAFHPDVPSYQDCTFAELTSQAEQRLRHALKETGAEATTPVTEQILEIYEGAIDTPDDAVHPVNFFEFFAVLALIGVTDGIRTYEIDHLSETHKQGTTKYARALEAIHESFDEYSSIVRTGLLQYRRINRILNLRSPFASSDETRGMFGTKYRLPLFHHVEQRS